ncbi:hypothetical protein ZOSMA_1G01480 [Zostera marina]|uniref:Uncharacterized protein n=1 Tax=Zostera marina TaxID=29655 RepID=A0A0K9PMI9_ZOSMR|nr:hypothetical protein ZOSMA_1G01480 [Zostera marina]
MHTVALNPMAGRTLELRTSSPSSCRRLPLFSSHFKDGKYTGMVEDCCCDYQTVDTLNAEVLHPILQELYLEENMEEEGGRRTLESIEVWEVGGRWVFSYTRY